MRRETLYRTLGAEPGASPEELRDLWVGLAKKYHDKGNYAPAMIAVNEAYAVLKDARTRKEYDGQLRMLGHQCARCDGRGRITRTEGFTKSVTKTCSACEGTGQERIVE